MLKISKKNIIKALIFIIHTTIKNIRNVNPLYLLINQASGYIEEKNGNKCLIFDDSVNENNELLKKYADFFTNMSLRI